MPNQQPSETQSSSAQQRVSEGTSRFAERVEGAAERAHTNAVDRVQKARADVEARLGESRTQAADRIQRLGGALRNVSEQLRSEDEVVANYVDRASHRVERLASYVASADLDHVGDDVQRFARDKPLYFFGGAFILGLAAGRFLKSSADRGPIKERELYASRNLPSGGERFGRPGQSRELVTDYGPQSADHGDPSYEDPSAPRRVT